MSRSICLAAQLSVGAGFPAGRSLSANDGVSAYGNITTISESPKARGTIYVGTDDGNVQMTDRRRRHWTDLTARFRSAGRAIRQQGARLATRRARRVRRVRRTLGRRHEAVSVQDCRRRRDVDVDRRRSSHVEADQDARGGSAQSERRSSPEPSSVSIGHSTAERHWSAASGNVPPVMVDRIIVNPRTNDLILGTHGRGRDHPRRHRAARSERVRVRGRCPTLSAARRDRRANLSRPAVARRRHVRRAQRADRDVRFVLS